MKRSVFASSSYCQLLRQWTRHSRGMVSGGTQKSYLHDSTKQKAPQNLANGLSSCLTELQRGVSTVADSGTDPQTEVFHVNIPEETKAHIEVPFRTQEDDPTKHNMDHEGLYYNVHKEDYIKYFQYSGQWPDYLKNVKTFNECAIMIRKPVLEVCEMIDSLNLNHPAVRIALYGKLGSGKTLSLAHIVHTYAKKDWFLVHVPMMIELQRRQPYKTYEFIPSKHFEGQKFDYNDAAVTWLKFCKMQNTPYLEMLKTTKEYSWTERETCKEGTSLMDIVTFGTERRVFASDCIGILLRELKLAATEKKIKMLVAIEGINGFFKTTKLQTNDKKFLNAQDITLFHHLSNLFKPTWSNGVCVGTLCQAVQCLDKPDLDRYRVPYTPQALLQKEGFEFMDPFIPVLVPNYTSKEIHNCLEYYIDRKWIQRPQGKTEEGKKELILLSNRNPLELMQICSYW